MEATTSRYSDSLATEQRGDNRSNTQVDIKQEIDHNVFYYCHLPGHCIRDCNKHKRDQLSVVANVKCFFDCDNKTDDNVLMSVKPNGKVTANEYVELVTIYNNW